MVLATALQGGIAGPDYVDIGDNMARCFETVIGRTEQRAALEIRIAITGDDATLFFDAGPEVSSSALGGILTQTLPEVFSDGESVLEAEGVATS